MAGACWDQAALGCGDSGTLRGGRDDGLEALVAQAAACRDADWVPLRPASAARRPFGRANDGRIVGVLVVYRALARAGRVGSCRHRGRSTPAVRRAARCPRMEMAAGRGAGHPLGSSVLSRRVAGGGRRWGPVGSGHSCSPQMRSLGTAAATGAALHARARPGALLALVQAEVRLAGLPSRVGIASRRRDEDRRRRAQ